MSDNILRDRLGPEKFEKAVEFYDADQKLTPKIEYKYVMI